jgi:hypothetical protein
MKLIHRLTVAAAIPAGLLGLVVFTGSAQITYVDGTSGASGNTALAAGGVFSPPLNGTTGLDDQWEERTTFGSGGNIFESNGEAAGEDAPRLVTTISGLTTGISYDIYAYFWSPNDVNQAWGLRAGLVNSGGDLTLYGRDNSNVDTDTDGFQVTYDVIVPQVNSTAGFTVAPTLISEGNRLLWQAHLGAGVADGSGQINVFIDDFAMTGLQAPPDGPATVNNRTWYDGVGYAAVPEPSVVALGGLGLACLLAFARRRMG